MDIAIIAAVAEDGTIGDSGEMPWHYPKNLQKFKERTIGHPVIFGRKTYESIRQRIGGPLPDRTNIILTSTPNQVDRSLGETEKDAPQLLQTTHVYTARGILEALAVAATDNASEVYIAGGGNVYEQYLPLADIMYLTHIHESYDGDTRFPEWDDNEWEVVDTENHDELTFKTLHRKDFDSY